MRNSILVTRISKPAKSADLCPNIDLKENGHWVLCTGTKNCVHTVLYNVQLCIHCIVGTVANEKAVQLWSECIANFLNCSPVILSFKILAGKYKK